MKRYETTKTAGTYQIRINGNKAVFSTRNKQAANDAIKILDLNMRHKEKTASMEKDSIEIEGFQLDLFT